MNFTYRIGTPEDVPAIAKLLETSGLHWPGELATPYVAEDEGGVVRGVFFKTLCFHAEPFCAEPGAGVSATEFAKVMRADFKSLATEMGYPITVYTTVQDNDDARAAAVKNGLMPSTGSLYEITIEPELAPARSVDEVIEAELIS